jgi:plasmid stabilization system protein ParE
MRLPELCLSATEDFDKESARLSLRSRSACLQWEDSILKALEQMAAFPESAPVREELAPAPFRVMTRGNYFIVYDPTSTPIGVYAILLAAQDALSLLQTRIR